MPSDSIKEIISKGKIRTLEEALTVTICFVTRDDLLSETPGTEEFGSLDAACQAAGQYFCDKRMFNRFHYQGSEVPVYALTEVGSCDVVAFAMPVNSKKVVFENLDREEIEDGEQGYLQRNKMKLEIKDPPYLFFVPEGYDN